MNAKILPAQKNSPFVSNSVFIFLIRFFPSLANIIIIILFSRNLPPQEYGRFQNFWIQLNIIYPIACFGLHIVALTYAPRVLMRFIRAIKKAQAVACICWILLAASVFAALQSAALHLPFVIPLAYLFVFSASFIFESVLIVFKQLKQLAFGNFFYSALFLLLHYGLVAGVYPLQRLISLLLILLTVRMFVYAIAVSVLINKNKTNYDSEALVSNARSLWLNLGIYDILQILFNWIDKFVISLFLSSSISAVYFNGSMNIPFLPLILSAVSSAVLMQLSSPEKNNNPGYTVALVQQSAKVTSSIVFPVFFFLAAYRYQLFSLLLSDKYLASVPIFLVSILVVPLRAYGFTTILQSRQKGKIISIGALLDLMLACLLMYPLYRLIGLPGIALSFVITTYLQSFFYLYYTARTVGVKMGSLIPFANWLTKLVIFALLFITLHYISAKYFTDIFTLILGCMLLFIAVLVSVLMEIKTMKAANG